MKKHLSLMIFMSLALTSQAQWTESTTKLTTSKDVGIGISDPAYKLDVAGDVRTRNIIVPNGYRIARDLNDNFTYKDKVIGHYSIGWNSDSWYTTAGSLWQSGYGGIKFFTGGKYRIGLTSEGDLGIGTEKPRSKLDVFGNMKLTIPRSSTPIQGVDLFVESFVTSENAKNSYYLKMRDIGSGETAPDIFVVKGNKNVGINVSEPTQKLDVNGNIKATGAFINGTVYANEVKVESKTWADFVFNDDYKLRSLEEVKAHIEEHKHLPDIPSEADVKENGVSLGEMQAKLLQKVEELTLYVIKQDEKNKALEKEIQSLKAILAKE